MQGVGTKQQADGRRGLYGGDRNSDANFTVASYLDFSLGVISRLRCLRRRYILDVQDAVRSRGQKRNRGQRRQHKGYIQNTRGDFCRQLPLDALASVRGLRKNRWGPFSSKTGK